MAFYLSTLDGIKPFFIKRVKRIRIRLALCILPFKFLLILLFQKRCLRFFSHSSGYCREANSALTSHLFTALSPLDHPCDGTFPPSSSLIVDAFQAGEAEGEGEKALNFTAPN